MFGRAGYFRALQSARALRERDCLRPGITPPAGMPCRARLDRFIDADPLCRRDSRRLPPSGMTLTTASLDEPLMTSIIVDARVAAACITCGVFSADR
jgi:hypothetical protein